MGWRSNNPALVHGRDVAVYSLEPVFPVSAKAGTVTVSEIGFINGGRDRGQFRPSLPRAVILGQSRSPGVDVAGLLVNCPQHRAAKFPAEEQSHACLNGDVRFKTAKGWIVWLGNTALRLGEIRHRRVSPIFEPLCDLDGEVFVLVKSGSIQKVFGVGINTQK